MIYLNIIIRIMVILISAHQFDKANRERNLGFAILWLFIVLLLCSTFSISIGGIK
jgi:ABC-type multidrug transport system permease subunit